MLEIEEELNISSQKMTTDYNAINYLFDSLIAQRFKNETNFGKKSVLYYNLNARAILTACYCGTGQFNICLFANFYQVSGW